LLTFQDRPTFVTAALDCTQAKRYHRFLMNHEEAVIKAFFLPTKRERYPGFIATAKAAQRLSGNFRILRLSIHSS
jgi:hypothetical protein